MKKVLVLITMLAAAGAAAWYVLHRDGEIPGFGAKPYPSVSAGLEGRVQIHDEGKGTAVVKARHRADLLYGQGLMHGNRGGEKLESLRSLFRGKPNSGPDPEAARLAELFYFLDLEAVAAASWPLYPAQVQVLISAYARGLSESHETETTWTPEDVLLMQRGYAFLMGRNLAKGWTAERLNRRAGAALAQLIGFAWGEPGGLPEDARAAPGLNALFTPFLETVYLDDGAGSMIIQSRTRPSLTWCFLPMTLELAGARGVEGMSLVGLPFLISGRNEALTWHLQAVLADDEQLFETARAGYLGGSDQLTAREEATHFPDYGMPPTSGRLGRMIGRLIHAREDADIWYHWDGFRPSADLTAAHYLMHATTVEEAITATQYHQVPPLEIFLASHAGRRVRLACRPSEPLTPFDQRTDRLFSGAEVGYLPAVAVRGSGFEAGRSEGNAALTDGRSAVDEELGSLFGFFLRDGRSAAAIGDAKRQRLHALFSGARAPVRDALVQETWSGLTEWLDQRVPMGLDLPLKRLILANLERHNDVTGALTLPRASRTQLIETVVSASSTEPAPDYGVLTIEGERRARDRVPIGSSDQTGGLWFVDRRGTVVLVSTFAFHPGEVSVAWKYPFAAKGKPAEPIREDFSVRIRQPHVIAPAL